MAVLQHHGIKGQKWGVQNGPPYPLKRITTKTKAKEHNEIYNTLSDDAKRKLIGHDINSTKKLDPVFTTDEELLADDHLKTFMAKYKDVPISSFSVWGDENKGEAAVSIMTRSDYQGQGYGSAVVKRGMEWIEKNPDIMTVYWDVRIDNRESIALAKKYGFRKMPGKNEKHPDWTAYRKIYKGKKK